MALEVTYNCDLCGKVGGAESTRAEALDAAKNAGWLILRVDDATQLCCGDCRENRGGVNAVRRELRKANV